MHTSAIITDEREHEMAYLVRHFTEAIAPWYLTLSNTTFYPSTDYIIGWTYSTKINTSATSSP